MRRSMMRRSNSLAILVMAVAAVSLLSPSEAHAGWGWGGSCGSWGGYGHGSFGSVGSYRRVVRHGSWGSYGSGSWYGSRGFSAAVVRTVADTTVDDTWAADTWAGHTSTTVMAATTVEAGTMQLAMGMAVMEDTPHDELSPVRRHTSLRARHARSPRPVPERQWRSAFRSMPRSISTAFARRAQVSNASSCHRC